MTEGNQVARQLRAPSAEHALEHTCDADCAPFLDGDQHCTACGVSHATECSCGGRGFHKGECVAIIALRREWNGNDAYVAVCDLALDGTEPTAEEWVAIEQDGRIGLYEGSTQDDARRWCANVVQERHNSVVREEGCC